MTLKKKLTKITKLVPHSSKFLLIALLLVLGISSTLASDRSKSISIPAQPTPAPSPTSTQVFAFYRSRMQDIVKTQNPSIALKELDSVSKSLPAVGRVCHGLAHEVGRAAFMKYGFSTALTYDAPTCGSGYLHGVVEERFTKSTDVLHDLITTCAYSDDRCLHGVGHGLMYFTSNDIPQSLSYCDHLPSGDPQTYCSEGVFMENFETDVRVHPSAWLSPKKPSYPCEIQSVRYKSACYYYAPVYYLSLHPDQYLTAITWCDKLEQTYRLTCATGVGSRAMKYNINQPQVAKDACLQVAAGEYRNSCIDGIVSYYLVQNNSNVSIAHLCTLFVGQDNRQCLASANSRKHWFKD